MDTQRKDVKNLLYSRRLLMMVMLCINFFYLSSAVLHSHHINITLKNKPFKFKFHKSNELHNDLFH